MFYHIFEINAFRQLTLIESVPEYRDAKIKVRELRKVQNAGGGAAISYRMMFAETPEQAERLLKEKREPRPMGEHD